jgi:predicted acylesterase/phospholipase RssA
MTGQHYNGGTDDPYSFRVERRELASLLRMLKDGQSVLVTGGRKIGKTVLLQQVRRHFELEQRDATSVVVPLYQDLMSLTKPPTATRLFTALSHKVPNAVNALLEKWGIEKMCQPAPSSWKNDPSAEFTSYLNDVLGHLDTVIGRVTLVYLLDECEALLGAEQTHTLLGNLRALIGPETDYRVRMVVTGFRNIKEYEDPETGTSPFTNVLLPLPLGLLDEAEFDQLIQSLLASSPEENRKALRNQIWYTTGGHPCVTQMICYLLTTEYSPQTFNQACTKATASLQGTAFSSWVASFTSDDHALFRKVLSGEYLSNENPLSVEFLQYCGVLTVKDNTLRAPCTLFNLWYEQQFNTINPGRTFERTDMVVKRAKALLSEGAAASAPGAVPSDVTKGFSEPRALVMKGGGVKGLAYVGALKELEKYYRFDWFVGTSAGAIAALLLAVGYTTEELENILVSKNFKEFLDDSIVKLPTNLIFKGGFYEARSLSTWLDELIASRIESFEPVQLAELPKRVTIYASRRYKRALVFDKNGPNSETIASFAVRCSMSIPFIFTPQRNHGLRVMDGGMQNNYPVSELLATNPETDFIGLYLGNYYEGMPKEPWLLNDMLSIWTEAVDVEALKNYKEKTVLIDPRPIKTTDFSLTTKEKEFLLSAGQAAALRFLLKRGIPGGPTETEVKEAEEKVHELRESIRANRKKRKWIKRGLFFFLILTLSIGLYLLRNK